MKHYARRQLLHSATWPLVFVLVIWIFYWLQQMVPLNLTGWGVQPRTAKGLPGIVTSVFVHGDLSHIASNTLPLLVLGTMLFYFYKKIARAAALWIWLVSGLWLWIGGRNSEAHPTWHIGASTLIYGLASFLFFSGVFRRHPQLMVVSLLVVFLYGSITWGIFPLKPEMSWEGHLFGSLAGLLVAFSYRGEGPRRRVYEWEKEEEAEPDTQGYLPDNSGAEAGDHSMQSE